MKQKLFFVFIFALPTFGSFENAMVKVFSYPCNQPLTEARGSGTLFEENGETYVLTSEHVVFHGNGRFCHSVANSKLTTSQASLVIADWGRGVAILRLSSRPKFSVPALNDLQNPSPNAGTRVRALGFPYHGSASSAFVEDRNAYVLLKSSERAFIPLIPQLIEVGGGHVEYGMSGGALISETENHFLGVISHQALRPVASGASQIGEISKEVPAADDYFVIPIGSLFSWIKTVIKDPKLPPSFVRDASEQLSGNSESVLSSELRFTFIRKTGGSAGEIGGAEGTGARGSRVGGAESAPGGAEGTGAGGLEGHEKENLIEISLASSEARWDFEEKLPWINKVKSKLYRRQRVYVTGFLLLDPEKKQAKKLSLHSLAQFVQLIRNKQLTPIAIALASELPGASPTESLVKELRLGGTKIQKLKETLLTISKHSQDANHLLSQVSILGDLVAEGDWEIIDAKWVTSLKSPVFAAGWQYLFNTDYENTRDLMQEILTVERLLGKLQVGE